MMTSATLVCLFLTPSLAAQFGEAVPFNDSLFLPSRALAIDVDLDGDPDAVFLDQEGRRIRWFETQASGELSRANLVVQDADPMQILEAFDVDLDGDQDLVVVRQSTPGWHENVAGTFAPFQPLVPSSPGISAIAVADTDGDGLADLILETRTGFSGPGEIFWRRGLATATFDAPVLLATGASRLRLSELVDVDLDGDLDLLFMDTATGGIACARNDGLWPQAVTVNLTSVPGFNVEDYSVGDVNGDGSLDLVFRATRAAGNDSYDYVAMGQGAFSFSAPSRMSNARGTELPLLVDLDGDNDLDLFGKEANSSLQPARWREYVNGSFSAPQPLSESTTDTLGATLGDLDGDGWADLLLGTSTGRGGWYRHRGTGTTPLFEEPTTPFQPLHAVEEFAADDFDLDGDVDHVAYEGSGIVLLRNDGAGGVTREAIIGQLPALPGSGSTRPLRSADFDGDGAPDLALRSFDGTVLIAVGAGDGSFLPVTEVSWLPTFEATDLPLPADIDGDGDVDLVLVGRFSGVGPYNVAWSANDGAGHFGPVVALLTTTLSPLFFDTTVVDLNLDGYPDIVVRQLPAWDLWVSWGLASGGVGPQQPIAGTTGTRSFALADMDMDADLDVIASNFLTDAAVIFPLQGNVFAPGIELPLQEQVSGALAIDADADGDKDVVVAGFDDFRVVERLYLFEQTGPLQFQPATLIAPNFPSRAGLRAVDFDRDGDDDILWSSPDYRATGLLPNATFGRVGSSYCGGAIPNSTGAPGTAFAAGSDSVGVNQLTVSAQQLPSHVFGFFVGSQVQSAVLPVPNSIGRLCLGGSIARFLQPGQVVSSGPSGQFFVRINLASIPGPTGPFTAAPGETWNFQAWHRDVAGGAATSNFTTATSLLLR